MKISCVCVSPFLAFEENVEILHVKFASPDVRLERLLNPQIYSEILYANRIDINCIYLILSLV